MRQLHDATRLISDRSYVAHLRAREQPLIPRVIAGNGVDQVYIFDGRQTVDLEIAKPPEMQPLAHHGVDSAVELLLFIPIPAGAVGEMHAGHTLTVTGAGGCRYNAPDGAREASLAEHGSHFLLRSLRVTQPAGMENVKIDDDVVI